jgi:hypothetical protein
MVAPDMMHTRTAFDLVRMVGYQMAAHGDKVTLNHHGGTILAEARQNAAKELIENGCDWILFVDSDMRFPVTSLQHLLAHGVDVVAANCSRRKRPIGPTARKRVEGVDELEAVFPDPAIKGLDRVETIGTGFMLLNATVFQRIKWPWFSQPWIDDKQRWCGEDTFLCGRLYEAGIPIYIDHDLSWAVKHIGNYEFGMQDVLNERQLVEAGAWEGVDGN